MIWAIIPSSNQTSLGHWPEKLNDFSGNGCPLGIFHYHVGLPEGKCSMKMIANNLIIYGGSCLVIPDSNWWLSPPSQDYPVYNQVTPPLQNQVGIGVILQTFVSKGDMNPSTGRGFLSFYGGLSDATTNASSWQAASGLYVIWYWTRIDRCNSPIWYM